MAEKKLNNTIANLAVKYKAILEKEIPVEKVIVFGSQAKGKTKSYSDIDIAVVSKIFGKDRHDEGVMLSRYTDNIDWRIEPHPFHPDDLDDPWDPLAYEIKKYGITIR